MTSTKNLTPIKIPGKNTRTYRRNDASSKLPARPRGRPMKATRDLKSSRSAAAPVPMKPKKPRSLKHIKSKRSMSRLERLPTELLERVFLFCIELNLPRASPVIAAKLSSDHLYSRCVMAAYGPYWQRMHNWENSKEYKDPELEQSDELSSETQSAILRCRWATLERLRNAEQMWLWQKQRELGTIRPSSLPSHYKSLTDDFFDNYYAHFSPSSDFLEWSPADVEEPPPLLTFRRDKVDIPNSLLNGPWDDNKVKHLFYLCRANAKIEMLKSTAGEEAMEGLHSAILDGNIHAVRLLHNLGIDIPFSTTLIKEFLSRNSETLSQATMNTFISYFQENVRARFVLPVLNAQALPTTPKHLAFNDENVNALAKIEADVRREVALMKLQGVREGNQKLVEWADVIEMIYQQTDESRTENGGQHWRIFW